MARAVTWSEVVGDPVLESDQPDRVALEREEVGDGGRRGAGVLTLAVIEGAIVHRPAGVQHDVAAQVRLVLEPLDVVAVGAGEEPPVEIAGVVPRRVLAVLAELDREAMVGAAVGALDETLDGCPGTELEALDAHQGTRVDERVRPGGGRRGGTRSAGGCHDWEGPFTCSRRRSITESTVTPSASAR